MEPYLCSMSYQVSPHNRNHNRTRELRRHQVGQSDSCFLCVRSCLIVPPHYPALLGLDLWISICKIFAKYLLPSIKKVQSMNLFRLSFFIPSTTYPTIVIREMFIVDWVSFWLVGLYCTTSLGSLSSPGHRVNHRLTSTSNCSRYFM